MRDWRIWLSLIIFSTYAYVAIVSAWTEHECETARYERQRRSPPQSKLVVPCVCAEERAEQVRSPPPPKCDWSAMTTASLVDTATLIVLTFTLFAILWQANSNRVAANAAKK